jgi:hypothetical protein
MTPTGSYRSARLSKSKAWAVRSGPVWSPECIYKNIPSTRNVINKILSLEKNMRDIFHKKDALLVELRKHTVGDLK